MKKGREPNPKRPIPVQALVLAGVFAGMLAVLSQIAIPLPTGMPITMQTFAVALCGFSLGARRGAMAVLAYLLLGAVGVPVFSSFQGGIGVVLGMTGGFLLGFIPLACLCQIKSPWLSAPGLIVCHMLGIAQFALVTGTPLGRAFVVASLPFLAKDAASVAAAYFAGRAVRRALKAARVG